MPWNIKNLQSEFDRKIRMAELDLDSMRKTKIPKDPGYKIFHDEKLGEWLVYKTLENSSALASRRRLVMRLQDMLDEGPDIPSEASPEWVTKGWNDEVTRLIKSFRKISD